MNRFFLTVLWSISSFPVFAHDFGWVVYGNVFALGSLLYSVYVVGKGKRIQLALALTIIWGLIWSSLYWSSGFTIFAWGLFLLTIFQPIVAISLKGVKNG